MSLLITGVAGFIGFHLAKYRLERGEIIIGIDNLNNYYDVNLKYARLKQLLAYPNFLFQQADLTHKQHMADIFRAHKPKNVVNLAAQAGVRYSLENPDAYIQSNVVGFANIIELCHKIEVEHLVYASSSSVYGANVTQPYSESDTVNHPVAIYAATKKANELIAHSYSHLYKLPTTGLRFFTVYGPWGRPDMALFAFTKKILAGRAIKIYNYGKMQRDFTYIDDIITGVSLAIDKPASPDPQWVATNPNPATSYAPYRLYNIGHGSPVNLLDYITALEDALGKKAVKDFSPMQNGDIISTHANTTRLGEELGYLPRIDYKEGIARFVSWYLNFYNATSAKQYKVFEYWTNSPSY